MSQHYGQNLESAVVIELKQTKDRQKLKTLAVSALAQIDVNFPKSYTKVAFRS